MDVKLQHVVGRYGYKHHPHNTPDGEKNDKVTFTIMDAPDTQSAVKAANNSIFACGLVRHKYESLAIKGEKQVARCGVCPACQQRERRQ